MFNNFSRNASIVLCLLLQLTLTGCGNDGGSAPSRVQLGGAIQGTPLTLTPAVTTPVGTAGNWGHLDGIGPAASFSEPYGVTTDGTYLYVTEKGSTWDGVSSNYYVSKILISTGAVTTLVKAANGAGGLNEPVGITTDGTYAYVCDSGNNAIRKIKLSDGTMTLLAGGTYGFADGTGAAAQFRDPYGITTDGTNLYVADRRNHAIRKIVIASGAVTTIAGKAPTTNEVQEIALAAGVTGGTFTITYNGQTTASLNFDATTDTVQAALIALSNIGTSDVVVSGDPGDWLITFQGTLATTNVPQMTVDSTNLTGGVATASTGTPGVGAGSSDNAVGTLAEFNEPMSITTDGTNLYVGDWNNFTIRKIVIATGSVSTLAGTVGVVGATPATFYGPRGLTTDGTNLYVADFYMRHRGVIIPGEPDPGSSLIRKVALSTGEVTTIAGIAGAFGSADGPGTSATFEQPSGITTDGYSLFVTDRMNNTIRKIN